MVEVREQNIKLVLLGVSGWHYCMKLCRGALGSHVQLDLKVLTVYPKNSHDAVGRGFDSHPRVLGVAQ